MSTAGRIAQFDFYEHASSFIHVTLFQPSEAHPVKTLELTHALLCPSSIAQTIHSAPRVKLRSHEYVHRVSMPIQKSIFPEDTLCLHNIKQCYYLQTGLLYWNQVENWRAEDIGSWSVLFFRCCSIDCSPVKSTTLVYYSVPLHVRCRMSYNLEVEFMAHLLQSLLNSVIVSEQQLPTPTHIFGC